MSSSSRNGCRLHQMPFSAMIWRSRLVGQLAVLDALHAGTNRRLHRLRGIGVHRHVGAPGFRGLDGGADLGLGVLRHVERVVVRRNAAARHHLDVARTQHQLLARAPQYLGHAVGDGRTRGAR